jgi:hypothetical protein
MSGVSDQVHSKSVRRTLQHTKRLAEHQIAHDVEDHPVAPVGHIPRILPSIFLLTQSRRTILLLPQQPTSCPYVRQDVSFKALDRTIAKCMAHHTSFSRMLQFVNATMHVDGSLARRKRRIEVGLSDIGAESVDGFESRGRVDAERVRPNADDRAVLLMGAVVGEMA